MDVAECELLWQPIHARITQAAHRIDPVRFASLASRAKLEATQFAALILPTSGHELNLRRVTAGQLTANWTHEMGQFNQIPVAKDHLHQSH